MVKTNVMSTPNNQSSVYKIAKYLTIFFSGLLSVYIVLILRSPGFLQPLHCYNADTYGWGSAGSYTTRASSLNRFLLLFFIAANLFFIYVLTRRKNSTHALGWIVCAVLGMWVMTLLIAIFGIHYIGFDTCH